MELSCDELESLKHQMEDFKAKASCYDELKLHQEKLNQDLDNANQRIKELEFEIASYADWKEITKVLFATKIITYVSNKWYLPIYFIEFTRSFAKYS